MRPTDSARYVGFGLGIQSTLPLPELIANNGVEYDVTVRLEGGGDASPASKVERSSLNLNGSEAILSLKDVGVFTICDGREIIVNPCPGAAAGLLRQCLLGNVMALLLVQRGMLVLHASAIGIGGRAVAFAGSPGAGKSSLAAALVARGHDLVTDDVAAIEVDRDVPLARPGFPQLKLNAKVASLLGREPDSLVKLHPEEPKLGWRVPERFARSPVELRCVYVLTGDHSPDQAIQPLRPSEAILELVRHTYPTRFLEPGGAAHFQQSSWLAKTVPFYRLPRSITLSALPELAHTVEEHVMGLA